MLLILFCVASLSCLFDRWWVCIIFCMTLLSGGTYCLSVRRNISGKYVFCLSVYPFFCGVQIFSANLAKVAGQTEHLYSDLYRLPNSNILRENESLLVYFRYPYQNNKLFLQEF